MVSTLREKRGHGNEGVDSPRPGKRTFTVPQKKGLEGGRETNSSGV